MIKKRQGFTLLEVIIALALTLMILGIANSMFIEGNKVFSDSDVKSTLQIEGQAIQEKISDIGMQATTIQAVTVDPIDTNQINGIKINSYNKEGMPRNFEIKKKDLGKTYKDGISEMYELWVGDELISSNLKSLKIDSNITNAKATELKNFNSVEFTILLRKEKGYSNVERTINFRVAFRNK
ncbi:PilW family protein [Clostridium beijerinckii]|uniref:Prepilin-type N-terminal cleavage/methylation domain-containing protein n=1 Tax=Clostridium beijerinckii TaxID=1520 RepID=A0A1S8S005_CLOBE|nr:prepilin-type N-terminal cleavage/methylation domain-containing protein [Clostridium beijerinckii]NRY59954.1 prepilin-type N-terminal cleavage/methylation domain-containing protein [Clostridium beijerinckii]OOM58782.1 hypothetical protein CLBCK_38180 [Clostridium beijerinckii]